VIAGALTFWQSVHQSSDSDTSLCNGSLEFQGMNEAAPWPICYVATPAWASRLARAPAWSWFETFLGPGLIKAVEPLEIAGRTDIEEVLGAWE
jgi:hypothetical protein